MRHFLAWTENGPAWTRLGWCLDSAWTARGNILLSSWWPVWWAIFQRSSHPLKAFTQKKPWRNLYQGKKKKVGSPRQWLCGCGVANPDLDLSLPDSGRLRSQVRICQRGATQRLASNEIWQCHSMNQATCVWPIQSHTPS